MKRRPDVVEKNESVGRFVTFDGPPRLVDEIDRITCSALFF